MNKPHSLSLLSILLIVLLLLAACSVNVSEKPEAGNVETSSAEVSAAIEEPSVAEEESGNASSDEGATKLVCAEPVKVGLITDITGSLAIYGVQTLRAFPLGLEYMAGATGIEGDGYTSYKVDNCEIQVYIRDDQSDPDKTATLGRELVEDVGVDFLVGTVSSGASVALQEIARVNNVIHINALSAANDLTGATFNENSFRTSRNNYQDAVSACQYLTKQYDKFVLIAPDYSFGYGYSQALRDACANDGGEFVVDDIFIPLDTTDFTSYMDQVLVAADAAAQVLIVTWAGGGMIPLLQTAVDLGITEKMMVTSPGFFDNLSIPTFQANSVGSTSGIIYHYTLAENEINDWFVEQTQDRFGTPPDLFYADGMNAAILIVEALRASAGDASAEALISVMEGMEFEGPKGMITIRQEDHVAIQDIFMAKLLNVDDPNFAFFEYVDTLRPQVPCLLPPALQDRCGDLPVGSLSGE